MQYSRNKPFYHIYYVNQKSESIVKIYFKPSKCHFKTFLSDSTNKKR